MKIRKALHNPFALVAQGFAVGAAVFCVAAPAEAATPDRRAPLAAQENSRA